MMEISWYDSPANWCKDIPSGKHVEDALLSRRENFRSTLAELRRRLVDSEEKTAKIRRDIAIAEVGLEELDAEIAIRGITLAPAPSLL